MTKKKQSQAGPQPVSQPPAASGQQQHQPICDVARQQRAQAPSRQQPKSQQQLAKQKSQEIQLPAKPIRKGVAPGNSVQLISNLFRISLTQKKDIYCHTIQIEALASRPDVGDQGGDKRPLLPRKIPKFMRSDAVKRAVDEWLENNHQRIEGMAYQYVLDDNASTMYSLFPMLEVHKTAGKRDCLEITTTASSPTIIDQKVQDKLEPMLVKVFSPTLLNLSKLVDLCAGKLARSSVEVEASLKAINTIMMPQFFEEPKYFSMQAKSGNVSVFPYEKSSQFNISQGVMCNKGLSTSIRPSEEGLVAVVSNTCIPLYHPLKLVDFVKARYNVRDFSRPLNIDVINKLKRELKTRQVEAIHINYGTPARPHYRKYRIHDIGSSTDAEMFELTDASTGSKRTTSVYDYFRSEYPNCKLLYPKLPCIIDNKRKIPLEICRLVEKQKLNRKLDPNETSEVIKRMAVKPEIHFETIQQNANDVIEHSQPLEDFGLNIERKPIRLTGRELPPISLLAAQQSRVTTAAGEYKTFNLKFVRSAQVKKWALVVMVDFNCKKEFRSPEDFKERCGQLAKKYCDAGRDKGVTVGPMGHLGSIFLEQNGRPATDQELRRQLRDVFTNCNRLEFDHLILIIPEGKDWIYSYMHYLEVAVPKTLKQSNKCTRASSIKMNNFIRKLINGDNRSIPMFLSNLWLKYNTKLGGVNIVLDARQRFSIDRKETFVEFLSLGFLFVSIDVCHPAPNDPLEQSVAAAVGMWNLTNPNMSYHTCVRVQRKDKSEKEKSTVEQVNDIGIMFEEILMSYKSRTNSLPTNVVILRDGVSEGQFQMVLSFELAQIKACISNHYNKLNVKSPKLACLTVQKRHKVRFMREKPVLTRRGEDYNIQPGTVVDEKVVQPNDFSFYLAPHKAIQGTARAPYVYMIYDEIGFSQDSAQAMIFSLSYLSPRCTKGTSIPTPINLADLAAERGKHIVVSWNEENQQKMSTDERLARLNGFLGEMGDTGYRNTLYYV